ncbi:MAG: acyltransferase, partial [Akkermansia sp.]
IGNDVKAGFGVHIMDSDFHALDPEARRGPDDLLQRRSAPVRIGENVFIGAGTFILKGVAIGDNAIIGACSVVTRSIPAGEIWAGNPARRIRGGEEVSPVMERGLHA